MGTVSPLLIHTAAAAAYMVAGYAPFYLVSSRTTAGALASIFILAIGLFALALSKKAKQRPYAPTLLHVASTSFFFAAVLAAALIYFAIDHETP